MASSNSPASNTKQPLYSRHASLGLAIGYTLFSILWIISSTLLQGFLSPNHEIAAIFQTVKDWIFMLVSASGLYYFVQRTFSQPHQPGSSDLLNPENLPSHRKKQEAVAQLGQSALESLDLDALFQEATALLTTTLDAELAKVLELLPNGKEFVLRAGIGWKDGYIGTARVNADSTTQAGSALLAHEPVIISGPSSEMRFTGSTMLHEHNVVSSINVIIPGHAGPFGILGVHSVHQHHFTRDDAYFMQAIANVLAAAIERARAEQALRDSEEKNRTIVSTAADGIITIDEQGIIRSFNPSAERLFGYSASEALGENVNKMISKPLDETGDVFGWRKDGVSIPLDLTISEMQIAGRGMFTYIARDITERVQATQAVGHHIRQLSILNRVLQVASAPIGFERMLDALLTEICEVFNAEAADIHLMDANVGLLYLLASRGLHLRDDQKYQHLPIDKSLRGEAIQKGHVVTFSAPFTPDLSISPDQADKIKVIAITPIWAGGQLRGTLAVTLFKERRFSEDELALLEGLGRGVGITIENARLYAEAQSYAETLKIKIEERTQELQKALIHAQSADRTKSALVSTVSHEMRTPLSSIIGFSNLIISRQPEMEKTLEYSVAINSEARRLSELINDFLDLQRLESGSEVFRYTEVDLADLTRDIIRKQQIDEDGRHSIRLNVSPVPFAYADPNRLRQVILNMLSNALKYSPNGGEIVISLWSEGDEIQFSIHDEGLGIAPEDITRIFDHFYRGTAAERYRIRGTGLGLGLCREIIQIHNGRIWGESPGLNLGATFTFALPILQPNMARHHKQGQGEERPLIVNIEDDTTFATYLAERLDMEGFDTQLVHFKAATPNYIGQVAPALIVLDILQGNEQSGWSILTELQRHPSTRQIPVIVCTSLEAAEQVQQVGAAGFMQKPIDEKNLIREIRRLTTHNSDTASERKIETTDQPDD